MKTLHALAAALVSTATLAGPAAPEFSAARFRAHVSFLADDLLEGRDTGSRGYDVAARYVASQFEAFGLEPGGEKGSWYQPVTLQKTSPGASRGALTVIGAGGEKRFPHGDQALVVLNPREPEQDITAPLVFVGYGVEDRRLGLDDYRGLDVKGCIVVTLRGFPKGLPSEEGAHVSATKAKVAQSHGAIGMVSIATLQSEKVFPWEKILEYANDPLYAWVGADGKAFDEAPAIRTRASLNDPAAEAVFAGAPRTLADIRREADQKHGRPRGFRLKTRLRLEKTSTWTRVISPNVIAILPGGDPKLAGEYVVLSAHLDHLGIKDVKDGPDNIHNGALDNAAGVATLLEVARVAAAVPTRSRRSLIFIASTAEEQGLIGADYYARHPTVPISRIVGNVDLDMPLLLYPFSDVVAFGADHSTIAKFVAEAAAPMQIRLAPDPMPEEGVFTRSDHYQFVKQGVPAVYLATGMASGGEDAWGRFLSGVYHGPGDDMSQAVDWQAAARFSELNFRVTRAMADSDTPPLWYAGDYFGDEFAPEAPRASR